MAIVLGQSLDRSHYGYSHQFNAVEEPSHPATRQLLTYWRDCEARGGMRMGRDVPARPIAALLRNVTVAEPVGDWEDARMRLAGFGTAEYFGRDVTGSLLSEIIAGSEGELKMLLAGSRKAIAKRRPGMVEHLLYEGGREVLRQEMTAFPLIAPDGDGYWILCSTFDFPRSDLKTP